MLEDPARHERVGESGDAVAAAAARGAAQHVVGRGSLGPRATLLLKYDALPSVLDADRRLSGIRASRVQLERT